jgi:diguanylate cyclase (GGDEF)-like protein
LLHAYPLNLARRPRLKRISDWILTADPEQRGLILRFIVGAANCSAGLLALYYGVRLGAIDANACNMLALCSGLVAGALYLTLRTGLNRRLAEPRMTEIQMVCASALLAWGYAIGGPARPVALILLFVVLMFGMFMGTSRQLVRASMAGALFFGGVMWHLAEQERQLPNGPQLQLVYFCVMLVMLIAVCVLGTQLADLRQHWALQQQALQEALHRIRELAIRDSLTGLYNRRYMLELLNTEKHRSNRSARIFCIAMLDVDHFKLVNDQHGHAVGDQVLSALAAVITSGLRETDVVARWGGEEFLVMFTDTDCQTAERVLSRIQQTLAQTEMANEVPGLRVRFSAGITAYQRDELLTRTLDRADRALYEAKAAGRNRLQRAAA